MTTALKLDTLFWMRKERWWVNPELGFLSDMARSMSPKYMLQTLNILKRHQGEIEAECKKELAKPNANQDYITRLLENAYRFNRNIKFLEDERIRFARRGQLLMPENNKEPETIASILKKAQFNDGSLSLTVEGNEHGEALQVGIHFNGDGIKRVVAGLESIAVALTSIAVALDKNNKPNEEEPF